MRTFNPPLPGLDDPRVTALVDVWSSVGIEIGALRHRVDANQKYLMARIAIWRLDNPDAPLEEPLPFDEQAWENRAIVLRKIWLHTPKNEQERVQQLMDADELAVLWRALGIDVVRATTDGIEIDT